MKPHARVRRATSETPGSVVKARVFQPSLRSAPVVIYVVYRRKNMGYMMKPIVDAQEAVLELSKGKTSSPWYHGTTPSCCCWAWCGPCRSNVSGTVMNWWTMPI